MNDVVISGRIPIQLMEMLRKLGKSNTEIINEALELYISNKSDVIACIQHCRQTFPDDEYQTIHDRADQLTTRKKQGVGKR